MEEFINERFDDTNEIHREVFEILQCYKYIKGNIGEMTGMHDKLFMEAVSANNREVALLHLCFVPPGTLGASTQLRDALPLAVSNDWLEVADALLELKVDPNSRGEAGRTAVSYCAEKGLEPYLMQLIKLGPSVDLPDKDLEAPLFFAVEKQRESIVKVLLKTGQIDINRVPTHRRTPLLAAAKEGNETIFKLLLDKGADVNLWDHERRDALYLAVMEDHPALVKLLLETGKIYTDWTGPEDETLLSLAAQNGREAVVKVLLDTGKFDVNSGNGDHETCCKG
jgi:ankyrin repeat protein